MSRWGLVISGALPRGLGQVACRSGGALWLWHRDRAPGDSPARRCHGHPSLWRVGIALHDTRIESPLTVLKVSAR